MDFRNDINGLRAIAVVAVVLFHFNVAGFGGGFVGVDVFFVISGFLMTRMIFPAVDEQRFSLWKFYMARAKRIVPALAAVCGACLAAGWFLLFPDDFRTLAKHVIAALLFISNIVFAQESGYFDASPFDKWLLHTWSLSVEWQFYLLYPVAVIALARIGGVKLARRGVLAVFAASLVISGYATGATPTDAFYLLHARAWELLAGAIVFLYPLSISASARKAIELAGLALILASIIVFSHKDAWPGFAAAVPVGGAMMVIWARQNASPFTANAISAWLGKCSYSVYLWHWPVVVGLHYLGLADARPWQGAGVAASVLIGWISYHGIERTTRIVEPRRQWSIALQVGRMLPMPAAVLATAAVIMHANGVPQNIRSINSGDRIAFVTHYRSLHQDGMHQAYRSECDFYDWQSKQAKTEIAGACTAAGGPNAVFLWGDSHAQALSLGLRKLVGAQMVSQVATSGCPPGIDGRTRSKIQNNCLVSNQYAMAEIARLQPGTVVLAQVNLHSSTDWEGLASKLHAMGVSRVILAGPQPSWNPALPMLVARNHWLDKEEYINDGLHTATLAADAHLKQALAKQRQVEYVSMTDTVCRPDASCRAFLPGTRNLIAVDDGHLSPDGSVYVVENAFKSIFASPDLRSQVIAMPPPQPFGHRIH